MISYIYAGVPCDGYSSLTEAVKMFGWPGLHQFTVSFCNLSMSLIYFSEEYRYKHRLGALLATVHLTTEVQAISISNIFPIPEDFSKNRFGGNCLNCSCSFWFEVQVGECKILFVHLYDVKFLAC